jgi:hypothetical protein
MKKEQWIHPKTIVGPPAEGDRYIRRPYLNDEFWREIEKGCHIHFTAPRRVGKTSVMKDLAADTSRGFICIYENVESDDSSQSFYKRLFHLMLNRLNALSKAGRLAKNWLKTIEIESINIVEGEIKFNTKDLDYKNELLGLMSKLQKIQQKVVLFIDEFPEVLKRIRNKEGGDSAIDVLHTLRQIRQEKEFESCKMVIAGSVGLDYIVESLGREAWINDLHPVKIGQLTREEASSLITMLTENATMTIGHEELEYLFSRDLAFATVTRENKDFNDWESRLQPPYLIKKEYVFCRDLLTYIAHRNILSLKEIFDLSIKYDVRDNFIKLLKMLMTDGYLVNSDEKYQFLSPLLKEWWSLQHPSFEIE